MFAAWIVVLLVAALAVLLLASHQPNTTDLRLPQWSDLPVAGTESGATTPRPGTTEVWCRIGRLHRARSAPRTIATCIEVTGPLSGISSARTVWRDSNIS